MLMMNDYVPAFIGDADTPWIGVVPQGECSRIVIGSRDVRTQDYIERTRSFPHYLEIFVADHDIFASQPEQSRELLAEFADCVIRSGKADPDGNPGP